MQLFLKSPLFYFCTNCSRMRKGFFLIALLKLCFFSAPLNGQEVGLVLSGGGSKGVAHIGVIKALEENDIPIDYVAGTSMGAVIGGLYAAGYSPQEMVELVSSEEFNQWVESEITKEYRYYFKKNRADASWLTLEYDLGKDEGKSNQRKISVPANIVSPHMLDFAIMETFTPPSALASGDFDNLFVPFRCVAADVANNQPVVLGKGDLGKSIRASMSFPFYFKPVEINDTLLFDGGMYNNFPKDVMKERYNPGIILGSKVASNYGPPKGDDLISQLQTMLMEDTDYSISEEEGILIDPDIPPTSITDFSKTAAYIDSGYISTIELIDSIKSRIERRSPSEYVHKKREEFKSQFIPIRIGKIVPQNCSPQEKSFIQNSFLQNLEQGADLESFKREFFKILADERISYIYPTATYNTETGYYDVKLEIEKEEDLDVSIGGNFSSDPVNEAYLRLKYKHLGQPSYSASFQSYIGRFYSAAQIESRLDNSKQIPFYLRGAISFNQWDYFETSTYFFEDKQPSYLLQDDQFVEIDVGVPDGLSGVIEFGMAAGVVSNEYYQENNFTRTDTVDKTDFDYLTHHLQYHSSSLNRKYYASEGHEFVGKIQLISGEEHYISGSTAPADFEKITNHRWWTLRARYRKYFPEIYVNTWGIHAEAVYSNQPDFSNYTSSALQAPAFTPIPNSKTRFIPKYRAYSYAALGLINITTLKNSLEFRMEGYAFTPYKALRREELETTGQAKPFSEVNFMGAGTLVFHSPLGPVSLSMNYYSSAEEKLRFSLNFGYIIFNKRPLAW